MKLNMNRLSILFYLLFAISVARADEIKIATFPIPLMVENEQTGVFVDLLREIEKLIPHTVTLSVYPTKRTIHLFTQQRIDGFFPALDVIVPGKVHRSSSIYVKRDFAFVKRGNFLPKTLSDLKEKTVGLTIGYPYVEQVALLPTHVSHAVNDYANVLKLEAGRVDVFVVEEKSGLQAIKASHLENIVYDPDSPLSEQDVYFAFLHSNTGKAYAQDFTRALNELKENGTFEKIMSKAKK